MASVFTKNMAEWLAVYVRDNSGELYPSSKEKAYADRARTAWGILVKQLNAEYGSNITVEQAKQKYMNMKKDAKKQFQQEKR